MERLDGLVIELFLVNRLTLYFLPQGHNRRSSPKHAFPLRRLRAYEIAKKLFDGEFERRLGNHRKLWRTAGADGRHEPFYNAKGLPQSCANELKQLRIGKSRQLGQRLRGGKRRGQTNSQAKRTSQMPMTDA